MVEMANGTAEARYLRGEVGFEDALREVTGIDIGRDDFAEILRGLAGRSPGSPELSDHDAGVLASAGFVEDPMATTGARLDRATRMQDLVRRSLSVAEAADRLGVTPPRIRQRLSDGTLWAFGEGRSRLLPPAQFAASGAVPHIERIAPLLAKTLHPLTVQALLTEPQPSLHIEGRPVSIVAWLTGCAGTAAEIEQAADVVIAAEWESA
ncbi:helix-turn-helix domain-containing protein [Rhodococcus tukisamuensis]|uniref:DNA binding domain-containing protein, excisionase family n=1 Tax=Rhodococcus tukisamuensis TaxID=168276 RepID=A0A1G6TC92_9NOCA|nr:helix-turn-helix domain-containing protein [Rhodococcus tukisamuensis]SDD26474.1 hypothetical protein SAMN05444580_103465 [Rhodococcus tukisamuensis]